MNLNGKTAIVIVNSDEYFILFKISNLRIRN